MDDRRLSNQTGHRIRLTDGLAPFRSPTSSLHSVAPDRTLCRLQERPYSESMMPSRPTDSTHPWGDEDSPYVQLGGDGAVESLANAFYDVIEETSPTLRAMLPRNTTNTRKKFHMYLSGWLGGPPLYEMKWGHPRLRMRHMPFRIGEDEAAEWMRCMREAISRCGVEDPLSSFLDSKFAPLADHMINQ